jgi:hypothetical protein
MFARNYTAVFSAQGFRGTLLLPWAYFTSLHKLLLIPFLVSSLCVAAMTRSLAPFHEIAPATAVVLGFQLVQMAIALVSARQYELLGSLPSYLLFRLIISFFAVETLLSIRIGRIGRSHAGERHSVDLAQIEGGGEVVAIDRDCPHTSGLIEAVAS